MFINYDNNISRQLLNISWNKIAHNITAYWYNMTGWKRTWRKDGINPRGPRSNKSNLWWVPYFDKQKLPELIELKNSNTKCRFGHLIRRAFEKLTTGDKWKAPRSTSATQWSCCEIEIAYTDMALDRLQVRRLELQLLDYCTSVFNGEWTEQVKRIRLRTT